MSSILLDSYPRPKSMSVSLVSDIRFGEGFNFDGFLAFDTMVMRMLEVVRSPWMRLALCSFAIIFPSSFIRACLFEAVSSVSASFFPLISSKRRVVSVCWRSCGTGIPAWRALVRRRASARVRILLILRSNCGWR